jgi:transcriptional antiterminator NusG
MPGYVFVDFPVSITSEFQQRNSQPSWLVLRKCQGVRSVLGQSIDDEWEPFPVHPRHIEALMAAQLNMEFDDTRAARILREEIGRTERETTKMMFPAGVTVNISNGPLQSFRAEVTGVTGQGLVSVLVEIFGRLTPADVPASNIARIAA